MPNPFNILDANLNIHHSYLLEASAGTGKTFAIEHLVIRLLIEEPSLTIDQILIVTFTRAATRDLKVRIRSNLQKTLDLLTEWSNSQNEKILLKAPDYLKRHFSNNDNGAVSSLAKRKIEHALTCFDEANVFTIHSFCARSLRDYAFESDINCMASLEEQPLSPHYLAKVIKDFFRTGLRSEKYSSNQIKIAIEAYGYGNKILGLEKEIYKILNKGALIAPPQFLQDLFIEFKEKIQVLKIDFPNIEANKILEDYLLLIPSYKKSKYKDSPEELAQKVLKFGQIIEKKSCSLEDFEQLIDDGLILAETLDPILLKARSKPVATNSINYPLLINYLQKNILPIILKSRDPLAILACMAYDCQKMIEYIIDEKEQFGPDQLLKKMHACLKQESFVKKIRSHFKAVIIDEFQDTDPIQWDIFKSLFLSHKWNSGFIYLVGDPKQAIYGFRQADIYTYLEAAQVLGESSIASLNTNYRSHEPLIKGLNTLFSACLNPGLMPLPHLKSHLPYFEVLAVHPKKHFNDHLSSLHFFIAKGDQGRSKVWPTQEIETNYFFPFIAQEIIRLNKEDNIPLSGFAILVKDRYQAERMAAYLEDLQIPLMNQQSSVLDDIKAISALIEILEAIAFPENKSSILVALGGKLIGWNHLQILQMNECNSEEITSNNEDNINTNLIASLSQEVVLDQFHRLRMTLIKDGFSTFIFDFLHSFWNGDKVSVLSRLVSNEKGKEFYRELQLVIDFIMVDESILQHSPEQILNFLYQLKLSIENGETILQKKVDNSKDAVQILTMHASKGLEYDVVFALGLSQRAAIQENFYTQVQGHEHYLVPIFDTNDSKYIKYLEEKDAEKSRLLYVAMTRAKYRLYLPMAISGEAKTVERGMTSPMELFFLRMLQPQCDYASLYELTKELNEQIIINFINKWKALAEISYVILNEIEFKTNKYCCSLQEVLHPPKKVFVNYRDSIIKTFSSLSKFSIDPLQDDSINENILKNEDEKTLCSPQNFHAVMKTKHTLPSNAIVGSLIHEILEHLPFNIVHGMVRSEELIPYIQPFLNPSPCIDWESVIAEIIFDTLKGQHDLKGPKNQDSGFKAQFSFCHLREGEYFKEIEFAFPSIGQELQFLNSYEQEYRQSIDGQYIRGVIDLVFVYEDKYYIVDWKTNWLGPNASYYGEDRIQKAIKSHKYDLQVTLYQEAWKRYLPLVDSRPFEACFGGSLILFLRGSPHLQKTTNSDLFK